MSRTAHARKPAAEKRALCRDLVGKRVELLHDMHLRKAMLYPRGTRMSVESTWRGRFSLCIGFASPCSIANVERSSFRPIEAEETDRPCLKCAGRYRTRMASYPGPSTRCAICGEVAP